MVCVKAKVDLCVKVGGPRWLQGGFKVADLIILNIF